MRWICLFLGFLLLMTFPAMAGHSPPKIFLRIYVQTAGEGLPASQATPVALPPNGDTILIRSLPEVTEHELIGVRPESDGGIRLFFNHQGQVALSAVTAENEGRIMVVMIDGAIIYAPVIDEQITDGQLVIPHPPPSTLMLELLQQTAQKNVQQASRT